MSSTFAPLATRSAHVDADLGAAALTMMESNIRADLVEASDCLGAFG